MSAAQILEKDPVKEKMQSARIQSDHLHAPARPRISEMDTVFAVVCTFNT